MIMKNMVSIPTTINLSNKGSTSQRGNKNNFTKKYAPNEKAFSSKRDKKSHTSAKIIFIFNLSVFPKNIKNTSGFAFLNKKGV